MKQNIWKTFLYTCVSFTTVCTFFNIFTSIDFTWTTQSQLQLLLLCVIMSATQTACNYIAALENRGVLRALINVAELFLLGGLLFGWFPLTLFPLLVAGGVSLLAYLVVWFSIEYRTRQAAEDINAALQQKRTNEEE